MRDFDHTVNVLVKAFFEGTLQHGRCEACAVGNIICASGIDLRSYVSPYSMRETIWLRYIQTEHRGLNKLGDADKEEALNQIECTGYTSRELNRIERAFESMDNYGDGEDDLFATEDEWRFKSLMAVVDVLADIHGIDLKAKEEAKLLFVRA